MPHWKLTLSYHGGAFHGWQVQPGLATVQGCLADALARITGESVLPQGSGRTDAGVHALAQVTSFSLGAPIPAANLQRALNSILPPSIRIERAEVVAPDFHARHSSKRKFYEYRIFERRPAQATLTTARVSGAEQICSPFLAPFVWDCRWALDVTRLQQAASSLPGTRDFSAMAAAWQEPRSPSAGLRLLASTRPNPVKTLFKSEWVREEGLLLYRVSGSGFLHHMVRNLVGTMVDIGRGSLEVEDLARILASRDRSQAGPTAPACGLYLVHVQYDNPILDRASGTLSRERADAEVRA